jgi:hypothetical protein
MSFEEETLRLSNIASYNENRMLLTATLYCRENFYKINSLNEIDIKLIQLILDDEFPSYEIKQIINTYLFKFRKQYNIFHQYINNHKVITTLYYAIDHYDPWYESDKFYRNAITTLLNICANSSSGTLSKFRKSPLFDRHLIKEIVKYLV